MIGGVQASVLTDGLVGESRVVGKRQLPSDIGPIGF